MFEAQFVCPSAPKTLGQRRTRNVTLEATADRCRRNCIGLDHRVGDRLGPGAVDYSPSALNQNLQLEFDAEGTGPNPG
jgi:hypothetical protein